MSTQAHLWALGFDDVERAAQVREAIVRIAKQTHDLNLLDVAVAVRYPDGSLTFNGEPFPVIVNPHGGVIGHLLGYLALAAPPLTCPAVGTLLASTAITVDAPGISEDFVRELASTIKRSCSVLFVLDEAGDLEAILRGIKGLGGVVLKSNVDLERAKLIQATLTAAPDANQSS